MSNEERKAALDEWMAAHFIKPKDVAKVLGCSHGYACGLFNMDKLPPRRHAQLVALGFPPELLPPAAVKPEPIFPGLLKNPKALVQI